MLLRVRIACSAPSARVQIGTVGQFRQLHYVGQCNCHIGLVSLSVTAALELRPKLIRQACGRHRGDAATCAVG